MSRCREERPGWKKARRDYWRREYQLAKEFTYYNQNNLNRMRLGLAPQREALLVHPKTGIEIYKFVSLELHHVFGLNLDTPHETQTLVEVWPWQHAMMDEDRKYPWQFVRWVGMQ